MRKSVYAIAAAVVAFGLAAPAFAAGPTPAEQTSAEQVSMCRAGLKGCEGGDTNACVVALKTCVGDQRQKAMKLMEGG